MRRLTCVAVSDMVKSVVNKTKTKGGIKQFL
jgi:hypothetical protein